MDLDTYLNEYERILKERAERHRDRFESCDDKYERGKLKDPDQFERELEKELLREEYDRSLELEEHQAKLREGKAREKWAEYLEHAKQIDERFAKMYETFVDAIDKISDNLTRIG